MKKINVLIVAVMLFVGGTSFVNAQAKVAHINTQDLISVMPEMKAAQGQLEKLKNTYDTEIKALAKEFDSKLKQYDAEAASKTEEENTKRAQEVQGMQSNIGAYRDQAMKDLQKKEVDLFQPILDKARAAIQKVARAKGIQYVLDATQGNGLLVFDGEDLLPAVKKELGI